MLRLLKRLLEKTPRPDPAPWECGCSPYCPGLYVTDEEIEEYYRRGLQGPETVV